MISYKYLMPIILISLTRSATTQDIKYKCKGESIILNGIAYVEEGIYNIKYKTSNGVDSVVKTKIVNHPSYHYYKLVDICEGDFYKGIKYTNDTMLLSEYSSIHGCDSIFEEEVVVKKFNIATIEKSKHLCKGDTIILSIGNFNNIQWSTGEKTRRINVHTPGKYSVTVADVNGCSKKLEQNVPISDIKPLLEIDDIKCKGRHDGKITIKSIEGGIPPYFITVNGKSENKSEVTNLKGGNYQLKIKDFEGCEMIQSIQIKEPESEFEFEIIKHKENIWRGDEVKLTAESNHIISKFQWGCQSCTHGFNQETFKFIADHTMDVFLTATDEYGCNKDSKIRITPLEKFGILLPNIFSPNSDGVNDKVTIKVDPDIETIEQMVIYDRYGNKVFIMVSKSIDDYLWDGTMDGKLAPPGIYVAFIRYLKINGERENTIHSITII